jgi:hypothetical protein
MRASWYSFASLAAAVIVLAPSESQAIPAFARKYGVACSTCHEVWPKLNDFGQLFRDNGYRMKRDRDEPVQQPFAYWPIAFRTTIGYQYLAQTQVPSDQGITSTQQGRFGFTGLDILTAGTLGKNISFLVVPVLQYDGEGFGLEGGGGSDLESAFIGFHDLFGTTYFNLRVGKHAPDLPIDEHRIVSLTTGYNIYHFHPQKSVLQFEPGENQPGVEIYGHSELSRFRYSVSFINANDVPINRGIVSNPTIWGHLSGNFYVENDFLAAVKIGAFGAVGWRSVTNHTITDNTGTTPVISDIPGTGVDLRMHERVGAEAHLSLISTINPLTISGVVLYGNEDKGLVGGTQDASWFGGFIEASYSWSSTWMVLARYEKITSLTAGDPTAPVNEGDSTTYTALLRHLFEITNRASVGAQLEFSYAETVANAFSAPPAGTTLLLAIDVAF